MFKEIPKPQDAPPEITTLRVRVEGKVQGVGFRAFVVREAKALDLAGWVRNRSDGSVELLASGPTKRVEGLLQTFITRPPPGARVAHFDVEHVDPPAEKGFAQRASM